MSKRTIPDYIRAAFIARDKASVAAIIEDAEAAEAEEHKEPDGDEGKQAIVIHNHHMGSGDAEPDKKDDDDDDWKKKTDDGMKEIRDQLAKITDMLTSRATAKDADGDDDKDKDDDDDKKEETKDIDPGEGALTATDPPSAEPDLMEADPALKTGPSMMGDSTYVARVNSAMNNLIRDTKARAEILAPGMKIGVLDGAMGQDRMRQAGRRICDTRRAALITAVGNERGMMAVGRHTADAIKGMHCDAVKMLFVDASDRMRTMNNAGMKPSPQFGDMRRAATDSMRDRIEAMNKRNAEFWAANGGTGRRVG